MSVFVIVAARRGPTAQRAIQKCLHHILGRFARCARVDRDAVLGEQIQRTPAHAASDDNLDALLVQPAGQKSRLVRRRNHPGLVGSLLRRRVGFDQGELFAVAKVFGQAASGEGNGNFHYSVVCFVFFHQKVLGCFKSWLTYW